MAVRGFLGAFRRPFRPPEVPGPGSRGGVLLLVAALSGLLAGGCTKDGGDDGPETDACSVIGIASRAGAAAGTAFPRIVNGTECDVRGSPVVQLTVLTDDGAIGTCSGTLIDPSRVLTAAHCFIPEDGVVTSTSALVEGRDVPVAEVRIHPEVRLPQNDVAVVTLEVPVTGVAPVPLLLSRAVDIGDVVSIYGYGLTDRPQTTGVLRSGQMRVTGINSQNVTTRFEEAGSNTCAGDSGGPAISRVTLPDGTTRFGLVGVTSFGTSAGCSVGETSAFANVQATEILDFITRVVPGVGVL